MKKLNLFLVLMCFTVLAFSQERYAVLICGEKPTQYTRVAGDNVGWAAPGDTIKDEFWNDTFLHWEMLVQKLGYDDDNVFVLYYDGLDYVGSNLDGRYKAFTPYTHITDYSAIKSNVEMVFNGLANGDSNNSIPKLTKDDFLFVWTFGHGKFEETVTGYPSLCVPRPDFATGTSDYITIYEMAQLTNPINTNKKVFWMQNCLGGLFAATLEDPNTVFHSAAAAIGTLNEKKAQPADNNWDVENELLGTGANRRAYQHGEFDFHNYSATLGYAPDNNKFNYGSELFSDADANNDNVTSTYESWIWESTHETRIEIPHYSDLGSIGSTTSLRFPTLMFENITSSKNHRGIIGVTKDVRIMPGQTLTLYDKAKVHFINDAKITVEAGASLVIGDNVEFIMDDPHGTSDPSHSALLVRGNISFGSDIKFSSKNGHNWKGLDFDAMTTSYSLQGIEFDHCGIYGSARLTVSNCTFDNAHVSLRSSTSSFSQCNFTNSSIYANVATSLHTLEVNNCSFDGTNEDYVIYLSDYQDFDISGNSISYSSGDGISLYYCGHGGISMEGISNNDIICSATSGTHYGVIAYQTDVDITNNTINGNSIGVASLNSSSSLLTGHTSVASLAQRITGNSQYQVYATSSSFPHTFEHNIIYGSSSPYVYAAGFYTPASLDVRNNYWGSNFNPSSHLYPSAAYDWFPVWTPNSYMLKESGPQDMLWQAMELVENGNYAQAENILKGIIDGYPEGEEAISATKVLYKMQAKHNSDYTGLKQYFQSTLELTEDTARMFRLLRSMVCWCDVKSGSLHQALSGFNQIIADPFDYPDQIFAELDKQYVEELVAAQANLKSDEAGRNTLAARQFELTRDLFGKEKGMDEWLSEESPLADLSAYQKTSGTATMQFDSEVSGEIEISLYSIDGRLCQQWHVSIQKGANQIDVELNSVPKGVHLVSLRSVGGQFYGSVKLSIGL